MLNQNQSKELLCQHYEKIINQKPSISFDYRFKELLEEKLELGKYNPFGTYNCTADFMRKLSTYKYAFKKYEDLHGFLIKNKSYISAWNNCMNTHVDKEGSNCYSKEFRELLNNDFSEMNSQISILESFTSSDFDNFEKCLEYVKTWNILQSKIFKTFYAHLTRYPRWIEIEINTDSSQKRQTCAECTQLDAIGPITPTFIALSAFFLPYETSMPDGTVIPEGVLVHENAGVFHELHEHVHAYIHEKKAKDKQHLHCDWIEEGIANWTALQILQPRSLERSLFLEIYDFWIIFNSIKKTLRDKIIKCWCF